MYTERWLWLKTWEKVTTKQKTEPEREKLHQVSKISLPSSEIIIKAVKRDFIIPNKYVFLHITYKDFVLL